MWVQVTDTTDVCLITVLNRKTVKNSNKICKWANNIINKTLLKDFLWHLLIAVKYREDEGGGGGGMNHRICIYFAIYCITWDSLCL